ncbi:VacJ family lipoprotein [Alphaproteobacteria bacterium KMM 3653]|uniref:VacJ family lipoprotein n=1 Tax=Harenicola maris TaxID=2841044 RepID=A0AAP2CTH9_9RHOB|nr:VacJ family lipoprotein [Harenicola maris]
MLPWSISKLASMGALIASLAVVSACAPAPAGAPINDPYEADNRRIHEFNKSVDSSLQKLSGGGGGGKGLPKPVGRTLVNFTENLERPGTVINNILQGDIESAVQNSFNFVINSTLGVGGIFNPSKDIGIDRQDTDFGETLHVWGAGEGKYMELPLMGPSTERDAFGKVVDAFLSPTKHFLNADQRKIATIAGFGAKASERQEYSGVIDDVLYGSADSYAQTRLLYLQNRRFELGGTTTDDDYLDPYEDIYAE